MIGRSSLATLGLLVGACGPGAATPIPQPPIGAFSLDDVGPSQIDPNDRTMVVLVGNSNSASARLPLPDGLLVRVTDLDNTAPPAEAPTPADGGFSLALTAATGDELRFEWILADQHSPPTDAILTEANGALSLVASTRFDCLQLVPQYSVEFTSTSATLTLRDGCAASVSLSAPRTRLGFTDFTLTTPLPLDIAPGNEQALALTFARRIAGPREDTLFLDVTLGTQTIRYPITLSAP